MQDQDAVISIGTTECPICLSELFPGTEDELALTCECEFCRDCVQRYGEEQISNGMGDIPCPSYSCDALLTTENIQEISDITIFKRYLILKINNIIALDSNRTWCPLPDCNTVCDIHDVTSVGGHYKYKKYSKCPMCHHEFFPDEMENDLMAWKIQELNPNTGMCPKCNVLIERNGGCSLVLCRNCFNMIKVEKSKIVLSASSVLFVYIIPIFVLAFTFCAYISIICDLQNEWAIFGAVLMLIAISICLAYLVYEMYIHNFAEAIWNYITSLHL